MPTTDRIFLGLVVSALVVASAQNFAFVMQSGFTLENVLFGFVASVVSSLLVAFLVQLPIWTLLYLIRVPLLVASCIAAALTCAAYAYLIWVLSNHPMPDIPRTPGRQAYIVIGAFVGTLAGFVCWRMAKEELV